MPVRVCTVRAVANATAATWCFVGLSVSETGLWLGTGIGVVSGLGGMACGFVVDRVYKNSGNDPTVWMKMITIGQVLAFPIYALAVTVESTHLALFLSSAAAVPQGLAGPSQNTAQMAVVPPQLRATTTGMAEVCWTGANAVGPVFGGILSDMLGDPDVDSNSSRSADGEFVNSVSLFPFFGQRK